MLDLLTILPESQLCLFVKGVLGKTLNNCNKLNKTMRE
jgi:hypothetical protein